MAQATAQTPMTKRWQEISIIWKDNRWLYVLAGLLLGILVTPAIEQITGNLNDLIGNLVPEAVGIIFTVLILDRLASNRTREALQKQLFREAGGQSNETAKAAVDRMRAEGWLTVNDNIQILKSANLTRANLEGANLEGAKLQDANLFSTNLQGADLVFANLESAYLVFANLEDTDLGHANLQGAYLMFANLQGANLLSTNLQGADFEEANLQGANLRNTSLSKQTLLPDGTKWTPETDIERFINPEHPDFWQADRWKKQDE